MRSALTRHNPTAKLRETCFTGWKRPSSALWMASGDRFHSPRRTFLVRLTPESHSFPAFLPGQYFRLSFPDRGLLSVARAFSVASSPTETGFLDFYVRDQDDWTGALRALLQDGKIGKAKTDGPYGRFSYRLTSGAARLVFIAIGIGAAPFLSMFRFIADADSERRALLIWGARSRDDLFALAELENAAKRAARLRVIPCLSGDPLWRGEKGRLSAERLRRLIPKGLCLNPELYAWESSSYWINAPKNIAAELNKGLRKLGVPRSALHNERRLSWTKQTILPA